MSTPITHNQLFACAAFEAVRSMSSYYSFGLLDSTYKVVQNCAGWYNYPDAVQAIKRADGSILSRKVSHFELAKAYGFTSNGHKLFSPQFLRKVSETDVVKDADYHDTCDQAGDVIGQYTDWYSLCLAEKALLDEHNGSREVRLMVALLDMHLGIADWYNDRGFRKYVFQCHDGSIRIGNAIISEKDKRAAFGSFKSLLMRFQENESARRLRLILGERPKELSTLNDAIMHSYQSSYSQWLAENTLKYVKPITLEETNPSDEEFAIIERCGIEILDLQFEAERFVAEVIALTAEKIRTIIE